MIRNIVSQLLNLATIGTPSALQKCAVAATVTSLVSYTGDVLAIQVPVVITMRILPREVENASYHLFVSILSIAFLRLEATLSEPQRPLHFADPLQLIPRALTVTAGSRREITPENFITADSVSEL